jgi:tetratricopeptide (TPR) repeat protein
VEAVVTALRYAIAAAAIALGAWALHAFCVLPYRCNVLSQSMLPPTTLAFRNAETVKGRILARSNLDTLAACFGAACRDVSIDMLAAANYRSVADYEAAIRTYGDALRRDERPEIYLNLAAAEVAAGRRDAAREHLFRAAQFNPYTISQIEDGALRHEVVERMLALRPENADFIRITDTFMPGS